MTHERRGKIASTGPKALPLDVEDPGSPQSRGVGPSEGPLLPGDAQGITGGVQVARNNPTRPDGGSPFLPDDSDMTEFA